MNEVVRFRAPNGDEMVMLAAADYDQLLAATEDAADVAAYDRARARVDDGEDELLPADVVRRILAGESKIKVWREYRGLTSAALAKKAEIGQGYLSQIETGRRAGTVGTLQKIAAALDVSLGDVALNVEDVNVSQARATAKIGDYLATVENATGAMITDALSEVAPLATIEYALQLLVRAGRVAMTGADEPEGARFRLSR